MITDERQPNSTPVGVITDFDAIEAAAVIYFRMWNDSVETKRNMTQDLANTLGQARGAFALQSFAELCELCIHHKRIPMMRHSVGCDAVGAYEACFANFIAAAADGDSEDAMLLATLLVSTDVAPALAALASNFGSALKQMNLAAPRDLAPATSHQTTLH